MKVLYVVNACDDKFVDFHAVQINQEDYIGRYKS